MPAGESVALALALALAGVLLLAVWVLVRRALLGARARVFEVALKTAEDPRFNLGIARFRTDRVEWFPLVGLTLRPGHTFRRGETFLVEVRRPRGEEATHLAPDVWVAELRGVHEGALLALGRGDLTAFSSWTEAAPPGAGRGRL